MRRFFVILEMDPGTWKHETAVDIATFLDSRLGYPGVKPVTVYTSLEDLNADHILDALAGTRDENKETT